MPARFEAGGLAVRERAAGDARRQIVRLTPRGREVFAMLDERTAAGIRGLLGGPAPGDRRRPLAAMRTIHAVLGEEEPPAEMFGDVLRGQVWRRKW